MDKRIKYPVLKNVDWLRNQVTEKPLRQIAEEIGSSYSAIVYFVKKYKIIVPHRTTNRFNPNKSEAVKAGLKRKYPNGRFGELSARWKGGNRYLLDRYGITIKEKQAMFNKQEGKCLLCEYKFRDVWQAATDHNHETGKIRGLLCRHCNIKMATLDDKVWMKKALIYQSSS